MLTHNSEKSADIAWQILEITATVPNAEIQVAFLGVNPPGVSPGSVAVGEYVLSLSPPSPCPLLFPLQFPCPLSHSPSPSLLSSLLSPLTLLSNCLFNPRVLDHLSALGDYTIPTEHAHQYA